MTQSMYTSIMGSRVIILFLFVLKEMVRDMDKRIKTKLRSLIIDVPDCVSDRRKLRSILLDYFPKEKQLVNAILNAYDEDITKKLKEGDRTLTALHLIKTLKDDYGLTDESALLSIEAWCYILNYEEVADALTNVITRPSSYVSNTMKESSIIGSSGIYKAGIDFPAGELCLQVMEPLEISGITCKLKGKTSDIKPKAEFYFKEKIYVTVEEGEYLDLSTLKSKPPKIRVTRIE